MVGVCGADTRNIEETKRMEVQDYIPGVPDWSTCDKPTGKLFTPLQVHLFIFTFTGADTLQGGGGAPGVRLFKTLFL